jgi:hypothetical protein
MMITNSLFKIKEAQLYSTDMEHRVLMKSMARATLDLLPVRREARDKDCSRLG